jgi:hypothetical protein
MANLWAATWAVVMALAVMVTTREPGWMVPVLEIVNAQAFKFRPDGVVIKVTGHSSVVLSMMVIPGIAGVSCRVSPLSVRI